MQFFSKLSTWLLPEGKVQATDFWQVAVLIVFFLISHQLTKKFGSQPDLTKNSPLLWLKKQRSFLLFWALVVISCLITELALGTPAPVFRIFALLGAAWILIGLSTGFIRDSFIAESVASIAYLATCIWILFQIDDGIQFLRDWHLGIGSFSVSVWSLAVGLTGFIFAIWLGLAAAKMIENQLTRVPRLSASLKVLIAKIIRIGFIAVATIIALSSMGVDLSALTVLSGAIGLGLGFGLQKVISNFVSGIILLLDNSIKPGDVIEIDQTYGWINNLRARYASVITRDGTEHLIPNEDLITQRVINWTFTNNLVRIKVPIGVSYDADPHQCIQLIVEAAKDVERVLQDPTPVCLLKGFGDSAIDLELRFWIRDPSEGVANIKSIVLLKVWDTLKANNIEIPFPQRDLHIRSSDVDVVPVSRENPDPE